MIRALVDFALKSRWLVLGGVVVLTAWGVVSFKALPIEAYPDVANNYVQIITQWPGRSAEEIDAEGHVVTNYHVIQDAPKFADILATCFQAVADHPDALVSVGANPTEPDTIRSQ